MNVLGPLVGAADVRAAWGALGPERQRAVVDLLMTVTPHSPGRGRRNFDPDTIESRRADEGQKEASFEVAATAQGSAGVAHGSASGGSNFSTSWRTRSGTRAPATTAS